MSDLALSTAGVGLDIGNVSVILGMLECIHNEVSEDVIMAEFATIIQHGIGHLRDLQQLAYETMLEVEAERASARRRHSSWPKRTQ